MRPLFTALGIDKVHLLLIGGLLLNGQGVFSAQAINGVLHIAWEEGERGLTTG